MVRLRKLVPLLLLTLVVVACLGGRAFLARSLPLPIHAEAAIALDLNTGTTLISKRPDTLVYPASLTKLMTALLLAESRFPGDLLTCSETASLQEPAKLGLKPFSSMTAAAAMDALLVGSANDVACMVAEEIGGTVRGFASLMNAKAESLGMLHSNFVNPTGLHDQNHYSTAKDLATLFKAALENPWVAKSLGKAEVTVTASAPPRSENTSEDLAGDEGATGVGVPMTARATTFDIKNTNPLLGKNGCIAGKTGHTAFAGKCLAALYEKDEHRIIAIVMRSPSDNSQADDMEAIIKAAWQALQSSKTS